MKWFKHDSDANRDAKLEKVLMRYGAEGYGLYWLCLELIAAPIDKSNLSFELEHDSEILAYRLKMDSLKVEEIMRYFVSLDLFETSESTQRITCLKLASRIENSIVKNPQLKEIQSVITESLDQISENPGQSRKTSARLDQTRLDQRNIYTHEFEKAWDSYPQRSGSNPKKRAYSAWNARIKDGAETTDMIEGINRYHKFIKETGKASTEFVMQMATFLGPDEHFKNDWIKPTQKPEDFRPRTDSDWVTLGKRIGLNAGRGESMTDYIKRIQIKMRDMQHA